MKHIISLLFVLLMVHVRTSVAGEVVPVSNFKVNDNGQSTLTVASTTQQYFILYLRNDSNEGDFKPIVMAAGMPFTTVLTDPLGQYPISHYQIEAFDIAEPGDNDGDGIDDWTEFNGVPRTSPFNHAKTVDVVDGHLYIDQFSTYNSLSLTKEVVMWADYLNGKKYVKFVMLDFDGEPELYFMNTDVHGLHNDFAVAVGLDLSQPGMKKGQLIFHPNTISPNGTLGTYTFNYSDGHGEVFDVVQRTQDLLAANIGFLENNMAYYITANNEDEYSEDSLLYAQSRMSILFEKDLYAGIDYWGLNPAEGYGYFRQVSDGELPGARDIVLYDALPNNLPRVGGIITSVFQTPLSHVNLRAIQSHIPNAFIRNPLENDTIESLLGKYIYYKVRQDGFEIREVTLEQVNAWYEGIRPRQPQFPPLNLDYTEILPLDDISFDQFDAFGAKCANVATMRTFDLPDGTIPNGFGVPFYYYMAFMEHNDFFADVQQMMDDPDFQQDRAVRENRLTDFRARIRSAEMPEWMLEELQAMHDRFPAGTSVRCRSSTNNEDLPGFNGAGLYDSKTQHPHEGHIQKSIKQVYASLWNLRAFEERDFYRIDHFTAAMGVLCHPNFSFEKSNGVGVSADPIYNTKNTFYLNTQLGEELITNPEGQVVAEEILLDKWPKAGQDYVVIQRSNLVEEDTLIMSDFYLEQMREYLKVIHDEFAVLYDAVDDENFAVDIEYKVTQQGQLAIKQARPWVGYVLETADTITASVADITAFPNPAWDYINVGCEECSLKGYDLVDVNGSVVYSANFGPGTPNFDLLNVSGLPAGLYDIEVHLADVDGTASVRFVKMQRD